MKLRKCIACTAAALFLAVLLLQAQKTETKDGILLVHNGKTGLWGDKPGFTLEPAGTIGALESEDENVLFYMPSDVAVDTAGNVYVLDSGNHRIQKFDARGNFLASLGRKGQGPGEFQLPQSLDIDAEGRLYVSDPGNQKIHILEPDGTLFDAIALEEEPPGAIRIGKDGEILMGGGTLVVRMGGMGQAEELPPLIKVLDGKGRTLRSFGERTDFGDFLVNRMGNRYHFALDGKGSVYVAFDYLNRIEKFTPDGNLAWRADRKLPYPINAFKVKGKISGSGGRRMVEMPRMNRCSNGIAVDGRGRIWVVGLKRQPREDEQVQTNVMVSVAGGQRSMNLSLSGNTDLRKTDIYVLEVYDQDGALLGKTPVDHFVDDIRIAGDRIFLLDKMRGMQVAVYRIRE